MPWEPSGNHRAIFARTKEVKEKLFLALRSIMVTALGLVRELLEHEKVRFRHEP